jgi:hypothetical protein
MIGSTTQRMISLYMEEASAPMFLSGFFESPPQNFHNAEQVTIDVERDDEDVAIVVTDLTVGGRHNESSLYTNKGFTPPIFKEEGAITAYDLIKRQAGQDPFRDPEFAANAVLEAFKTFRKLEKKIRRSIELMASQVLQTGKLTLRDSAGTALYELDFLAKATHKATASADWGGGSENPLLDLEDLAIVVRRDGKKEPNKLVFGKTAWRHFKNNAAVQKYFDKTGFGIGQLAPVARGSGATFHGWVWIGQYRFEMWTYDGFYRDPQTGDHLPYIDDDNVIMLSEGARLDLTYGAIPMIKRPDSGPLSFLPPRMSDGGRGLDFTTNAWFTPNGETLMVSAGTRPLTIPTAIDTFACLNTQVP